MYGTDLHITTCEAADTVAAKTIRGSAMAQLAAAGNSSALVWRCMR
jgi:hypothetical protein